MRMKSNTQHVRRTFGPQQQRTVDLAGEETPWLAMPLAVLERLKRLAPVKDQLRMAVGNDALWNSVVTIVLQNPKAIDEGLEPGRRSDFTIPNHICMIL